MDRESIELLNKIRKYLPPRLTDEECLNYYKENRDRLDLLTNNSNSMGIESSIKIALSLENIMLDFLSGIHTLIKETALLKGCMCLKRHLDNVEELRLTQDIDFSLSSKEAWEKFVQECCSLATANSKYSLVYNIKSRRGYAKNPNGDSLTIEFQSEDLLGEFKIDMNIKPEDFKVSTTDSNMGIVMYSIEGILHDKINVFATRKLCRRIKDLIDIYYISSCCTILIDSLLPYLQDIEMEYMYGLDTANYAEIKHAYDSYKMERVSKPEFDDIYSQTISFVLPLHTAINSKVLPKSIHVWDPEKRSWR